VIAGEPSWRVLLPHPTDDQCWSKWKSYFSL